MKSSDQTSEFAISRRTALTGAGAAPVELMRLQGMEMYQMRRRGPGSFMMKGSTVTFMTDVASGEWPSWVADEIPDAALKLWWTAVGGFVWLHNETVYPPGLNQPRKQRQSNFVRKDHFADRSLRNLPCAFTVSFWAPWSWCLGMEDMPGHMVWHTSGTKLNSVDDLPDMYRKRIEKDYPEMMTVKVDDNAMQRN